MPRRSPRSTRKRGARELFDEWRGGVGLILPVARRIIEAHGGRIWGAPGGRKAGARIQLASSQSRSFQSGLPLAVRFLRDGSLEFVIGLRFGTIADSSAVTARPQNIRHFARLTAHRCAALAVAIYG